MAKSKKTAKTKASKSGKGTKGTAKTKPAATTDECLKGGRHKYKDDGDGERYCGKCFAPKLNKISRAKPKPAGGKARGLSAIDAAAQILANVKKPMNCKELIEAMATKGLWTSPGGKTPHATLYSAIIREIATKGKEARFAKTERGHFGSNA